MTTTGLLQDVTQQPLGSELYAPATAGDMTIQVVDAADFGEGLMMAGLANTDDPPDTAGDTELILSGGGLLRVGGDAVNAEVRRYVSLTEPDDDDDADDTDDPSDLSFMGIGGGFGGAGEWDEARSDYALVMPLDLTVDDDEEIDVGPSTITFAPLDAADPYSGPLTQSWGDSTRVDVWDAGREAPAVEWRANCRPVSETDSTDAIDAVVAYYLVPLLPEGVRDTDAGEIAILDDSTGDWRVVDVVGRVPMIQADHLPNGSGNGGGTPAPSPVVMQNTTGTQTTSIAANTWTQMTGWSLDAAGATIGAITAGAVTVAAAHNGALLSVRASVTWTATTVGGRRAIAIYVNGVEHSRNDIPPGPGPAQSAGQITHEVTATFRVATGDTIAVQVWQNTTAALALLGSAGTPNRFQLVRLA